MTETLVIFFVFLAFFAAVTQETFVLVLIYLLVGAYLFSRWWAERVLIRLIPTRIFQSKAFPEEIIQVEISIQNPTILPALWLRVQDLFPVEIADLRFFHQVIHLGPRSNATLSYQLKPHKRGYYPVGPLLVESGDLLGMSANIIRNTDASFLTVYPRVIPIPNPKIPSRSPLGTLRHTQPVFEDPTRPLGKRDYQPGDSLRRIDWKATASVGRMQTKIFEPSIALDTAFFLNLNTNEYPEKTRYDATELAIVATASLANWVISKRQSASLVTNGQDPLSVSGVSSPISSGKGRPHLMRMLELMARIKAYECSSIAQTLNATRHELAWGTTIILVTGSTTTELFDELVHARHSGLTPVLVLCGRQADAKNARAQARLVHIPVMTLSTEEDLKAWQP
jgi:uncharacterized protein (DUF58 family)